MYTRGVNILYGGFALHMLFLSREERVLTYDDKCRKYVVRCFPLVHSLERTVDCLVVISSFMSPSGDRE